MTLVPRFRRGSSLSPINSVKHIIDTEGAMSGAAQASVPLATTVESLSTPFNAGEVLLGSKINAFYITFFSIGATGSGQTGSINWILWKQHAGQSAVSPNPSGAGDSEVRNQIIHQEKGLAGSADGTPMAFKGVIVVPRGMRRMRSGDIWFIRFVNTDGTNDVNFCVQSIYKSFR